MSTKRRFVTLVVGTAVAVGVGVATAGSASATIHPITNGFACGNASGDPPGQTPGENHSDHSTFRALQSTGFLTITDSGPVLDTSVPASKYSTFNPETETGTATNPAAIRCTGQ